MTKRWVIAKPEPALAETLARELHLAVPLAQVLVNRGYGEADKASQFLNPQLRQLGDPFDLPDMATAVDRILAAIEKKERIAIYGDYDVDGVTSSALLQRVLRAAGATVTNFLPHRMDEGYGLTAGRYCALPEGARPATAHRRRLRHQFGPRDRRTEEARCRHDRARPSRTARRHCPECVGVVNPKRLRPGTRLGVPWPASASRSSWRTRS